MYKLTFILILLINGLFVFGQPDTLLNRIESKGIDKISFKNSDSFGSDSINILLQGKLSDPIICNELGFETIGGTEIPNFGLSIDYNPLFLKRYIGTVGYRRDFKNNHIFIASIESKYLFNKNRKHYDLKIAYERFKIENSVLNDYQKISLGSIYRIRWTSFGLFLGQDSYEKQIGIDLYLQYYFHKLVSGTINEYKSRFEFESIIGFWNREMIYDLNLKNKINFNYSVGLGYKKQYDFEEVYFTFRYLLCH